MGILNLPSIETPLPSAGFHSDLLKGRSDSGNALGIKGERKSEHKEEREGFYKSERSYGQFYRSIPLPDGAKADQAKAELNDGVLKVSVPVPEAKKTVRQITVEEGTKTKPAAA